MPASDRQREQAHAGLEQLASLMRAQSWRAEGAPALPPTQAATLRMLAAEPEGLRARQIAERLGISAASLSDTLKTLESRGWIVRSTDPGDRRASIVRLARQGRSTAARLSDPERGGAAGLLQALDTQDVGALLRVTQLLVGEAQRQGLASGMRTCMGCRFFQPYASGDPARPHVCGFVGEPFGDPDLRVNCREQEPADALLLADNHARFHTPPP